MAAQAPFGTQVPFGNGGTVSTIGRGHTLSNSARTSTSGRHARVDADSTGCHNRLRGGYDRSA